MSLEILRWYIVDTDRATIVRSGSVQAVNLASIKVGAGQILRLGNAHPFEMWERNGELVQYTLGEKEKQLNPPGRGYVWRASKMEWEDRRPIGWAKEDKIAHLLAEHGKRKQAPVTIGGVTIPITPDNLHRAMFAAQAAPASLRENDLRWRDVNGTMKVWASAAAFKVFAQSLATAAAQQFSDVDRWKDDLLDRINAATLNSQIDGITW